MFQMHIPSMVSLVICIDAPAKVRSKLNYKFNLDLVGKIMNKQYLFDREIEDNWYLVFII